MRILISVSIFVFTFFIQDLYSQCSSPIVTGCNVKIVCFSEEPTVWFMGDGTRIPSKNGVSHDYRGRGTYRISSSNGFNRVVTISNCTPAPGPALDPEPDPTKPPKICSSISIFPNPTNVSTSTGRAEIRFRFTDSRLNNQNFTYSYEVTTFFGAFIASGTSRVNSAITLRNLAAASYKLKITCPDGKIVEGTFIAQRD